MADNLGLLAQLGLNLDPAQIVEAERRRRMADAATMAQAVQYRTPGEQAAAMGGSLFGAGLNPPQLTEDQNRRITTKNVADARMQAWLKANPEAPEDEKSDAYNRILAESAAANGLTDIASQLYQAGSERKRLKERQAKEFEKLGYETRTAKTNAQEAERGDLKTVWLRGSKDPDASFTGAINPETGEIVDNSTGRVLKPSEYTFEKPLDPRRGMSSGGGFGGEEGGGLSDESARAAALDILLDPNRMRTYASYGRGGQLNRDKIVNARTQMLEKAGLSIGDVARLQARAKAETKSIGQLIEMKNAVTAYEYLAKQNGDRVLELIEKVNTSGIPLINSALRLGKAAIGNPDAAELLTVMQNYQTEVARIVANPRLVGQLTDTARTEIQDAVPANMTVAQAKRVVERLAFEFELRGMGIDQSLDAAYKGFDYLDAVDKASLNKYTATGPVISQEYLLGRPDPLHPAAPAAAPAAATASGIKFLGFE